MIDAPLIDDLLNRTMERIRSLQHLPQSTYRLQLHKDFTFRDATQLLPYLSNLGISHVYASPYFKAKPGSMHGYDVLDHCTLNPELGTQTDYDAFLAALRQHGMWHLVDFVPNHVGVATNENTWWNDVLENGPASRFANYFDITWDGSPLTNLKGRLLLPLLGDSYGNVLEKGELKLVFENNALFATYFDRRFPISPRTYPLIFAASAPAALRQWIERCEQLADRCEGAVAANTRHQAKEQIRNELAALSEKDSTVRSHIDACIAAINGKPGDAASFDRFDKLLQSQCYRLASWRTGPDEINYRRFFDVNDLAAIAMEHLEVFEATHQFVLSLLASGKAAGLRIDHPDGLFDPRVYFTRLQQYFVLAVAKEVAANEQSFRQLPWTELRDALLSKLSQGLIAQRPLYVLGEKILAMNEIVPADWPVHGTSGYDFLNMTNGLFVDGRNAEAFTQLYHQWTGDSTSFADLIYQKKKLILEISLASELHMLGVELKHLAQRERHSLDFTLSGLIAAMKEVIACFPVYRSYIAEAAVSEIDRQRITEAVDRAISRNPEMDVSVFHFVRDTLLLKFGERFTDADRSRQRHFAGKFQQLTAPATAKGIEDTAFYIYNRLLSLNEVGGDPAVFGVTPQQLHAFYSDRQSHWPDTLSSLSTHDTKRSEDVRARLNVLSGMPDRWGDCLANWSKLTERHRAQVNGRPAPDRNDEYAFYQTLLGAWPEDSSDGVEFQSFIERVQQYALKSMRESKVHTSWTRPNKDYEDAVKRFLDAILDRHAAGEFWDAFIPFQKLIAECGHQNSLAQTILKLTAPGVPDTYQGCEMWDFSLVDPDNRRPINYQIRKENLQQMSTGDDSRSIYSAINVLPWHDPRRKVFVCRTLLRLRRDFPDLFARGDYLPLKMSGTRADNAFAFARQKGTATLVVIVPRLFSTDIREFGAWIDLRIILPQGVSRSALRNVFSGETVTAGSAEKGLGFEAIGQFPHSVFMSR